MRRAFVPVFLVVLAATAPWLGCAQDVQSVSLTILCDNYVHDPSFQAEWGFSCLVTGLEKTILFDVGGSPGSSTANLRRRTRLSSRAP